jgi:hypothetical protein
LILRTEGLVRHVERALYGTLSLKTISGLMRQLSALNRLLGGYTLSVPVGGLGLDEAPAGPASDLFSPRPGGRRDRVGGRRDSDAHFAREPHPYSGERGWIRGFGPEMSRPHRGDERPEVKEMIQDQVHVTRTASPQAGPLAAPETQAVDVGGADETGADRAGTEVREGALRPRVQARSSEVETSRIMGRIPGQVHLVATSLPRAGSVTTPEGQPVGVGGADGESVGHSRSRVREAAPQLRVHVRRASAPAVHGVRLRGGEAEPSAAAASAETQRQENRPSGAAAIDQRPGATLSGGFGARRAVDTHAHSLSRRGVGLLPVRQAQGGPVRQAQGGPVRQAQGRPRPARAGLQAHTPQPEPVQSELEKLSAWLARSTQTDPAVHPSPPGPFDRLRAGTFGVPAGPDWPERLERSPSQAAASERHEGGLMCLEDETTLASVDKDLSRLAEQIERLLRDEARRHGITL